MTKNTFKNGKTLDVDYFAGLFGCRWVVYSSKQLQTLDSENLPVALSGSFDVWYGANRECAERNRDIFV